MSNRNKDRSQTGVLQTVIRRLAESGKFRVATPSSPAVQTQQGSAAPTVQASMADVPAERKRRGTTLTGNKFVSGKKTLLGQ